MQKGLWAGWGHGGLGGSKKISMSSRRSGCKEPTPGGLGSTATGLTFAAGSEDRTALGSALPCLLPFCLGSGCLTSYHRLAT